MRFYKGIYIISDAFWWSIETITIVAYGEFYPVTSSGRVIAGVTMFGTTGFLLALIGTLVITRKFREAQKLRPSSMVTLANEIKELELMLLKYLMRLTWKI